MDEPRDGRGCRAGLGRDFGHRALLGDVLLIQPFWVEVVARASPGRRDRDVVCGQFVADRVSLHAVMGGERA